MYVDSLERQAFFNLKPKNNGQETKNFKSSIGYNSSACYFICYWFVFSTQIPICLMLTMIIMPAFQGTRAEFTKALILTLMLDIFILIICSLL